MTPLIRPTAALCLALLLTSNSSRSQDKDKSQPPPTAAAASQTTAVSPVKSADKAGNPPGNLVLNDIAISVDVLANRHVLSSYVYGGAYPQDAPTITDSGMTVVRWGGNATSRYNWQAGTYNAANDWYFADYGYTEIGDSSSTQFITDVKAAGSSPLMTMVMLGWVAKDVTDGSAYSFSVAKYGAQCAVNPYNSDDGDGVRTDCATDITGNDPTDADVELNDSPQSGDPPGTVYRNQWAAALATAFGSAPHFYDMDNEIDIWGSTHRDVHPNPSAYNELRDTYRAEADALKGWDPSAIRLGPVSCCWWFYWNGANNNDKGAHAGNDFLPWWLNEVYWQDQLAGTRSVDIFDIHAYPDGPDTSGWTLAQERALSLRIYRDYWDPTYVSESGDINQQWVTQIQPNRTIPFRIPRMRATANMIYPGTPLSITEWSANFAGETDYSTALADADAYGILGRERVYLASRWTAPAPANPNYQALKLYRNYDGQHHGFATTSVSDTNNYSASLFSSYAALNSSGTSLTVMILNKNPLASVQAQFSFNGFTPRQVTTYTLSPNTPTRIVASPPRPWTPVIPVLPYTATLLVVSGTAQLPSAEWDLNPDTTMVAAGGTVVLQPEILSGSGTVTLGTPQSDSGIVVTVTQGHLSSGQNGSITVTAGQTPGFYHFTVPSTDNAGVSQKQSGWIVVGNPPASLTKTGDNQSGPPGGQLNLAVTLNPGSSGGSAPGATILFTTTAGSLSSRTVVTNSSGSAPVVLTLPSSPGTVHVTAEGPYGLGHPDVVFTETVQ
ncbi:MAG: glycoside hydrolase family 44 protein [Candidatus Korobacteraceae bacterium]